MRYKNYLPGLVVILFFIIGFLLISQNASQPEVKKYVKISGQNIEVELAVTPAEQERGLSGRSELKYNTGMLFVFTNPGKYSFWMKDMNFPIDIIWISADKKVIYIKKDARPEKYPETYGPSGTEEAKYVLEVVSGFSEKNDLKIGDKVEFSF